MKLLYKNSTNHSPNRLEKLPVSFAQLKHLKWLDLKDNPLCPALKQAAGDCITPNDCALCAKKVLQASSFLSVTTITFVGGCLAAEHGEPAAEGETEKDGGGDEGQEGAGEERGS